MDEKKWEPSGIVWGSDPEEIQDTEEPQDTAGPGPQESQATAGSAAGPARGRVPRPAFRSRGAGKKRSPLKTIGIIILVLFVLSTISRACGRKDTASEPKQAETPAAAEETAAEQSTAEEQDSTEQSAASEQTAVQPREEDTKKDRNGYRSGTNARLSYCGFMFEIPSYFRKQENDDEANILYNAPDPDGKIVEAQLAFVNVSQENIPDNLIEKQGDILQENLVNGIGTGEQASEVLISENVTLAGKPARHVIAHSSRYLGKDSR